ncbi:MAG: hypothetical protein JOZ68_03090 [Acidimicrobiia bacterium]|nr:hypothetical protein [Acidimicrobiia bacterium]
MLSVLLAATGSAVALQRSGAATPSGAALVAATAPAGSAAPPATTAPATPPPTFACHDAPAATQAADGSPAIRLRAAAKPTTSTTTVAPVSTPAPAAPAAMSAAAAPSLADASCHPTPDQAAAAQKLVDDTRAAIARFDRPSDAVMAGYVASWSDNSAYTHVAHYTNWNYWNDGRVFDPNHVEGLLYGYTARHGTILLGAFYLAEGDNKPDPGGCLMQWHQHNGSGPWMMHVWTVPMPGGPFDPDPDPAYIASL